MDSSNVRAFAYIVSVVMTTRGLLSVLLVITVLGVFFGDNLALLIQCQQCYNFSIFSYQPVRTSVFIGFVTLALFYGFYQRYKAISLARYVKDLESRIDPKRSSTGINADGSLPN